MSDILAPFLDRNQPEWARAVLAHALVHQQPEQAEQLILDLSEIIQRYRKARKPVVVHLETRSGRSICGRTAVNLSTELSEITCLWCERALAHPKAKNPAPPDMARNRQILELLQAGETMRSVGEKVGLSRARVGQIAQAQGFETGQKRSAIWAQRRAEKETAYETAHTKECRVCQKPFIGTRTSSQICDNEDCGYIYRQGRRYLEPKYFDSQRVSQARHVLRNPEAHRASEVLHAQKLVNGTATSPNRRYVVGGSKIAQALERVGREDLIPGFSKEPRRMSFVCRATSLSGNPCSRPVPEEGMLCHIHNRATKHAF